MAYGPFRSFSDAYSCERSLRPRTIDRARDCHMTHALDRYEAITAPVWFPRCD